MGNRLAVMVGINAYPARPLENCVNDIESVRDYLVRDYGWQYGGMRLLVDGRATTKAILDRLGWMRATVRSSRYRYRRTEILRSRCLISWIMRRR